MARKHVLITLPLDLYRRLVHLADDEERVVDQQASLLLKRALLDSGSKSAPSGHRDADGRFASARTTCVGVPAGLLQSDPHKQDEEGLS